MGRPAEQPGDEVDRRVVAPVQVVEDHHDRFRGGERGEQRPERGVQPVALVEQRRSGAGGPSRQAGQDRGEVVDRPLPAERRDGAGGERRDVVVERVGPDRERQIALELGAAAVEHQRAVVAQPGGGLGQQQRLADPRWPLDRGRARPVRTDGGEHGGELPVPHQQGPGGVLGGDDGRNLRDAPGPVHGREEPPHRPPALVRRGVHDRLLQHGVAAARREPQLRAPVGAGGRRQVDEVDVPAPRAAGDRGPAGEQLEHPAVEHEHLVAREAQLAPRRAATLVLPGLPVGRHERQDRHHPTVPDAPGADIGGIPERAHARTDVTPRAVPSVCAARTRASIRRPAARASRTLAGAPRGTFRVVSTVALPSSVEIREVGPRDGLQVEAPLSVEDRVRLVRAVAAAGFRTVEVGSFVSPEAVPAMADSAAVVRASKELGGFRVAGVVLNARGATDAVAAGVDELTAGISASEGYSRSNTRMSIADALGHLERICATGRDAGTAIDVTISCCFGSPYEGEIAPQEVAKLVTTARELGATSVGLADTTGMATPRGVHELLAEVGGDDIGMHFHETRGTGLVNVYASLQAGVTRFDSSVGGLGGSPFATGAAGNVATEGIVSMLDDLGVETGVDLPTLLRAAELLHELVGHDLPSPVSHAGPRIAVA